MSTNTRYTESVAPTVTKDQLLRILRANDYTPGRGSSVGVQDSVTRNMLAEQDDAWDAAHPDATDDERRLRRLASRTVWGMAVLVLGPPGAGKTGIVEGSAIEHGLTPVTLIASQQQPEDVAGFPIPDLDAGQIRRLCDSWLLRLHQHSGNGAKLVLDELTTADEAMLAAMLRLLSDRAAGERELSPRVRLVAMGNRPGEAPGARGLEPAAANRFIHFTFEGTSAEDWADWLLERLDQEARTIDPNVEEARVLRAWPQAFSVAKAQTARYIKLNPAAVHQMQDSRGDHKLRAEHPQASGPWASHRTWEMAARALAGSMVHGLSRDDTRVWLTAILGTEADAFVTWIQNQDIPDVAELIERRGKYTARTGAKAGKLVTWKHDHRRMDISYTVAMSAASLIRDRKSAGGTPTDLLPQAEWVYEMLGAIGKTDPDMVIPAVRILFGSAGINFAAPGLPQSEWTLPAGSAAEKTCLMVSAAMTAAGHDLSQRR